MRGVNTDAVSYQYKTQENCLGTSERYKSRKYINACLNKRMHFTHFFALVYGLLGVKV